MNKKLIWISITVVIILSALGIGLYFGIKRSPAQIVSKNLGSVVSNGHECAAIGGYFVNNFFLIIRKTNKKKFCRKILQELNGSVADAAIATLFCEGVAVPQSCGLGGGFFLTIYTKATGKVETLNAREIAPIAATADMFVGETTVTGIR